MPSPDRPACSSADTRPQLAGLQESPGRRRRASPSGDFQSDSCARSHSRPAVQLLADRSATGEPPCERRSKSALFCRHHLGDGECRSISGRPVQPVGPMVANDGWAGEPLSRPIAAEGGGRRPAFTVAASPAKLASRVDRLLAGIIRHAIVLDEVSACGTLNLCPI